jgi:hypothetical protein
MTRPTARVASVVLCMAGLINSLIAAPATRPAATRPTTTEAAVPALPPAGVPLFFYRTPKGWLIRIGPHRGEATDIDTLDRRLAHFMFLRNAVAPRGGAEIIIFEKHPIPPELFDAITRLGSDLGFDEVRRASKEEVEDHLYEEQTGVVRHRPRATTKPR